MSSVLWLEFGCAEAARTRTRQAFAKAPRPVVLNAPEPDLFRTGRLPRNRDAPDTPLKRLTAACPLCRTQEFAQRPQFVSLAAIRTTSNEEARRVTIRVHEGDLPDLSNYRDSVAIDTETMGLKPHRDRLCVVQLSPGDGTVDIVRIARGQSDGPQGAARRPVGAEAVSFRPFRYCGP